MGTGKYVSCVIISILAKKLKLKVTALQLNMGTHMSVNCVPNLAGAKASKVRVKTHLLVVDMGAYKR